MPGLRYTIKDLENFTLIKAHTIRIWEKRYGLFSPKRTETNFRFYSEDDLKKILNIKLLYEAGNKISKIAKLSEAEIIEASRGLIKTQVIDNQSEIDALTLFILKFQGEEIKSFLSLALSESSLEELYQNTVLPLLKKLGQLWQVNTIQVVHEHYFSQIFKEFLICKTSEIDQISNPKKTALLFLHDSEEHEFSILLYCYILKNSGYTCHYFGQKAPIKEISAISDQIKPQIIVTTFTAKLGEKKFKEIESELVKLSKNSKVIISGSQLNNFDFQASKKLIHVNSIPELKSIL